MAKSIQRYADMVRQSRLLAPNLKEMTLHFYTGDTHKGNHVAREIVRDHLLALRWMNPNAIVYMREYRGQAPARIDYALWTGDRKVKSFEIDAAMPAIEAVAKVLMAARDPDEGVDETISSSASTASAIGVQAASLSSSI